MADHRVSVVVITHARRDEVLRSVMQLRALPEQPRVVVVDNASEDGTVEVLAARFPEVDVLPVPRNLGASGRNLGVQIVDTPYVAFCDDDTWWEPGSLGRAADILDRHASLAVVTARILVEPDQTDDPICEEMARSPLPAVEGRPGHPILSFLAGASVVRRCAFLDAGGFEPRFFFGGEEELLAADLASAGWALVYVPNLLVHHRASPARDPSAYRRRGIRNTLWFTWLRRPLPSAVRRTVGQLRRLPPDRVAVGGVLDALAGLPWVIARRRTVPPEVERGLRLLDRSQLDSTARQYVT